MEPELKKLLEKAQKVSMTDTERTLLSARIAELPRAVHSPFAFMHLRFFYQGVAALLIVALAGGSTAFAASSALPGDVLFPVKIHVNERVESLLAVTPEAEVEVVVTQAVRRLDEAEKLAHQGRLTEAVTQEIEDNFTERAEVVRVRVKKLRDSKKSERADDVEKRFNERVDSHFESFVKLESGEGSTTPGVREVRDTLERHRDSRRDRDKEDRKEDRRTDDLEDGDD